MSAYGRSILALVEAVLVGLECTLVLSTDNHYQWDMGEHRQLHLAGNCRTDGQRDDTWGLQLWDHSEAPCEWIKPDDSPEAKQVKIERVLRSLLIS